METHPREGVVKEETFPNIRKPSHQWVCGEFWNLRGQHNQEGKKQSPQNMCLKHNSQQRNNPDAPVCHQQLGEAWVACLG